MQRRHIVLGFTAGLLIAAACAYVALRPRPFLDARADAAALVEIAFPAKRGDGLLRDHPDHVVPITVGKDGGFATSIPVSLAEGDANLAHLPPAEQIRRRRLTPLVTPLRPEFPQRFTGDQVVRWGQSSITMRPHGGAPVQGSVSADGALVYRNAFPSTDVLYRSAPAKNEEFLVVKEAPAGALQWSWDIDCGNLIPHKTRLNVIEFRNEQGVALVRMDAPEGRDSRGRTIRAEGDLDLELVCLTRPETGGHWRYRLELKDPQRWTFPVVMDPSLSSCAAITNRSGFCQFNANSLADGRVLAFGGIYQDVDQGYISPDATWRFDLNSQTWTDLGASHQKFIMGRSALLSDGRILTSGNYGGYGSSSYASRIYNPAMNQWTLLSSGPTGFQDGKVMSRLTDGRVMLGGFYFDTWLFNPSDNLWSKSGDFAQFRRGGQCVAALPGGKALACSGYHNFGPRLTCEIWDPANETWSLGPNLPKETHEQSVIGLSDGRAVLLNGNECYVLSADASRWDTIQSAEYMGSGGSWDPGLNMVMHPSGSILLPRGIIDTSANKFKGYGLAESPGTCPYLLVENKVLWLDANGRGKIMNLSPVCADINTSTHWSQAKDIILIKDALGPETTWTVSSSTGGDLSGQAPTIRFTPSGQVGLFEFAYRVTDSAFGDSNIATVTIQVTNGVPAIANQSQSSLHGSALTGSLVAIDPDGDGIQFDVVQNGDRGTLTFTDVHAGSFQYVPNSDYTGTDYITVSVTDGAGASATAVVTINMTNSAPVTADQSFTLGRNQSVSALLLASDPDGESLIFSVHDNGALGSMTFANPQAGDFQYTPQADIVGADQVQVWVTDGAGAIASSTVTFNIVARNQAPSMVPGPDITAPETYVEHVYPQWVQSVTCGPTYESDQHVAEFLVSVDQPQWYAVPPSIDLEGTLRFTPAGNVNEAVATTITMQVRDDGGTANGGNDLSSPITALINLEPVPDTYTVTTTADAGFGSLRDCLTRVHRGDTIVFDPLRFDAANSNAATVINVLSPLPALDQGGVTIDATDSRVTINGSAAGSSDGFVITSSDNRIFGLHLVGFTGSGIRLVGNAMNNQLGGSRGMGAGPNGQGLRIAGNGAYGIRMSGSQTMGNAVVGCWIGLSANGAAAEANLAGILIEDSASRNTIGSVNPDMANRIGGNTQEGIVITGSGSNGNIIIGNGIGGGQDRKGKPWKMGNGASGVFLSRGTSSTRVGASGKGGDDASAANDIIANGGYGIEIRSADARRNAFRGNRISGNLLGGIALFDGANGNIASPAVAAISGSTISGTAATDGTVELFNDQGDQGVRFLGRATVTSGRWTAEVFCDPGMTLTATFTDEEGNTSPFATLAPAGNGGSPSEESSGTCGLGSGLTMFSLFGFLALMHLWFRRLSLQNRRR